MKVYKEEPLYEQINSIYDRFFAGFLINSVVLCVHAGIPIEAIQKFLTLEEVFSRFKSESISACMKYLEASESDFAAYIKDHPISAAHFQIYWNDPISDEFNFGVPIYDDLGNRLSIRGEGAFRFSEKTLDYFFKAFGIKMMVRSHEAFRSGAKKLYNGKLWSVFSILLYGKPIDAKYLRIQFNNLGDIKKIKPISIKPLKD